MRNSTRGQQLAFFVAASVVCFMFTLHFFPMLQTSTARTVHPGTEHNPSTYRYNYEKYLDEFSPTPSSKTVLLGIFTTPSRVGNRKLVRDTWLSLRSNVQSVGVTFNYKFVVGSASSYSREDWAILMEENRKYDDFAILEDVHDTYKNISLKLLSFLKYSEREFPDADFIGKIDDDTYLNLDVLAKSIRYLPSERVRFGWFWYSVQKEEPDSKYFDAYWKLGNYYPVYAAGPAHLTSKDLVRFINKMENPLVLQNDDVNIDVWLYGLDILRIHDDRFHGGFNLCCKDARNKKLDFIGLVNLNNDNMKYVHDFVMDPSKHSFDKELAYYDCRCRIYHNPITKSGVIFTWICIGIIAFAFAKFKSPRATSHQYFP